MTKQEIIRNVKSLKLPRQSYVVFGSCPMALAGIREAGDIDLLVTSEVLEDLKNQGWELRVKGPKDTPYVHKEFEAHDSWDFSAYSPSLEHLLSTATVVDGVPFASLEEVRKWKAASNNPKFQRDVELIDEYVSQNK